MCALASVSQQIELFHRLFGDHSAHCALLNSDTKILAVNRSWRVFGLNNGVAESYRFEDQNYLHICEDAAKEKSPYASDALSGLLSVMEAGRRSFAMYYPCHSPTESRWFTLWAQTQQPASPSIVVAHTYIGPELNRTNLTGDISAIPPN